MSTKWFQKLTPEMAWEQYFGEPVELFISLFHNEGVTDVTEMCQKYANDIPTIFEQLYAQTQLDHIAKLMEQYINKVGYNESKLYTPEQLDELWDNEVNAILRLISKMC
ncbi:MAG TPA: hypothetical protein DGK91_07035 [Clostridium sp.]|nr:hypothetical protein [Clostridium sp.]